MPLLLIILSLVFFGYVHGARTPNPPALYEQYKEISLEDLNKRGLDFFREQKNDSAVLLLTMVVNRDTTGIDENTRKIMAKARNTLGIINFNHSHYQAAYTHFLKSIQLNDVPDATGYLSLASVYLHYGDKSRAFEYLKNYTSYAADHRHYNEASLGVANILSTDFVHDGISPDSIDLIVRKFLDLPSEVKSAKAYRLAYGLAQGWVKSHSSRHNEAVEEIKSTLSDLDTTLMPRTRHALYLIMADQYTKAGQKDSALLYIRNAEELAIANDYKDLLAKTYFDASRIYSIFGDERMSDLSRRRMLEINDSLFNPRELGKLHDLNMFYEVDKFERRMEIMAVRDRMRIAIIWTVGIALGIVIILLILLFLQNRDLKRKSMTLFERNLSEMEAEHDAVSTKAASRLSDNEPVRQSNEEDGRKYIGSNISDDTRTRILQRIREIFANEAEFCKEGFSLNELARMCDSNSRYVSQVINEDLNTTFAQLLNNERVKVARKRFMDTENYGNLTIEAIISDLGCKSRSTFSKTFKRITGLSPTEFQRMARSHPSSLPEE